MNPTPRTAMLARLAREPELSVYLDELYQKQIAILTQHADTVQMFRAQGEIRALEKIKSNIENSSKAQAN